MGGNPLVLISKPCITFVKLNKKSDFILIGCDGIFDSLQNEKILKMIWSFKKRGNIIENIHKFSGDIADSIIKYSMRKWKMKIMNIYIMEMYVNILVGK